MIDFERAWDACGPLALDTARRYGRKSMGREEIRQSAMIGLWEAARDLDPAKSMLSTYVVQRVRRVVVDEARSIPLVKGTRPRPTPVEAGPVFARLHDPGRGPAASAELREDASRAVASLRGLPAPSARLVAGKFGVGRAEEPVLDLARREGISKQAAHKRIGVAIARLCRRLGEPAR